MPRMTEKEFIARRREFLQEAGQAFDQMLASDGQNGLATFKHGKREHGERDRSDF